MEKRDQIHAEHSSKSLRNPAKDELNMFEDGRAGRAVCVVPAVFEREVAGRATASKSGIVTKPGLSSRFAELHRSQRPQGAGAS